MEVSIIVPTYNGAKRLPDVLGALRQQHDPGDFEVVIVNDGSTDDTSKTVSSLRLPDNFRLFEQENLGPSAARNAGLQSARGKYCLFVDDDCLADPALVMKHLQAQKRSGGVLAIGSIRTRVPRHANRYVQWHSEVFNREFERLRSRLPTTEDVYGANFSAPTASLRAIGGFASNLRFGEDSELAYRLSQSGLHLLYLEKAIVTHVERKTMQALLADAQSHGAGAVDFYNRHSSTLPWISSHAETSVRAKYLREALLAIRFPPALIATCGLLFDGHLAARWFLFAQRYSWALGVIRQLKHKDHWRQIAWGTPILMYHGFCRTGEAPGRYTVSPRRLRWQMRLLKILGYKPLQLESLADHLSGNRLLSSKSVVITIDDGYADVLGEAFPILSRSGYTGAIFVVSACIGGVNDWDEAGEQPQLAGRALLSSVELRFLADSGMTIGAHTRTHPNLLSLSREAARLEIRDCRGELEKEIGRPVRAFAYPYGYMDDHLADMVSQYGYVVSCSVDNGLNTASTPMHKLRRIEVCGDDSLFRFVRKLWLI